VIIHYLDIKSVTCFEPKADAPLPINSDAVPSRPISRQLLEPVRRRASKLQQIRGNMNSDELLKRPALYLSWQSAGRLLVPYFLRLFRGECPDHLDKP
jgi:hypothetical protein